MSEDPGSQFTITFGRTGRVVKKRAGGGSDDGMGGSGQASGSKRSVKDRLGTVNVDDSLEDRRSHGSFKRQRNENNQGCHKRNSSNDTSLEDDDLRFKLLQKNASSQFQNDDPPTNMDLRDKLSSKSTLPHVRRRRSYSPRRRSYSPGATLGKRKSIGETRDIYDGRGQNMVDIRSYEGERKNLREPRGTHRSERQCLREPRGIQRSMRDPRDSYDVERHRMREPRDNYVNERPIIREPRGSYHSDRRSTREPRDSYNNEKRSMQEHRDRYNNDRRSMRAPRDSYNVENRSMREPRDYSVERRSIREPRGAYNPERRSLQDPVDSYNAVRRSNSIERRSIREPRANQNIEEKSLQGPRGPRDNYTVGRRSSREPRDNSIVDRQSIREPRDSYRGDRRSMRDHRDFCHGGKPMMLDGRNDYDHRGIGNVGPGSRMGSDLPAVAHSRTPYTLDNLRRRSPPLREVSSSMSPERNGDELRRKAPIRTYDDGTSNAYRINEVPSPHRTARSATHIQPGLNAAPRLYANPAPVAAQFHQSSGALPRIPNHAQQSTTIDHFLQTLNLEEYSNHFKKEEVDYYALSQMSDPELKELGIPMGPRKRILHELSNLSGRSH